MEYHPEKMLGYAIEHNELSECMMGKGKYEYSNKNDPGPINEAFILKGFYILYQEKPELKVNILLDKILRELLAGKIEENIISIYYFYMQKYYESNGLAKFTLDNSITKEINKVVQNKKDELEATDGIKELDINQNLMKALRKINSKSINEFGIALFQE